MRLDKYLKVSRLIKRRTVANEITSQGKIFINNKSAKPSTTVKEGDQLKLEYQNKTVIVEIIKVPTGNVSIQESKDLYKLIQEINKTTIEQ
ncbi:MAG TPA: RNA-binding S4 domain-containing protein [Candidatus Gastranaerophilales bacterium]|nr:RNA-binding S4 domain-containing protein [Candidatus Gastranaerophilales bacterium]